MIIDALVDSQIFYSVHHSFVNAFTFLRALNLSELQPGKIDIDGDAIYALVQEYQTKPEEHGKWESHKRYIDIQYIVCGTELIKCANINTMKLGEYDAERDFQPMSGKGQLIQLSAGSFMVLFPQDAHMPGLTISEPSFVKKVVVKCLL